jgi:ribosomal protein S18 acetylase RimI-like enzyme
MKLVRLRKVTAEERLEIRSLLRQLSYNSPLPLVSVLNKMLREKGFEVWVVREGDKIIGIATLALIKRLSVQRARIEDVVVDKAYRGKGLGKALIKKLIERTQIIGISTIDLTSRPDRVVANKMYKKLGFMVNKTNVYRLQL